MRTYKDYSDEAIRALKGNWRPAVTCSLYMVIAFAVYMAFSIISQQQPEKSFSRILCELLSYVVLYLLYRPLIMGFQNAFKSLVAEGNAELRETMMKSVFGCYWHNVATLLLRELFIVLWSFLFIIPGIMMSLYYSMTQYIMIDYPELSPSAAIDRSTEMMKGHRWELVLLYLRFSGWILLGIVTFGIGFIWISPYMSAARAGFYLDVKADYEARTAESKEVPQESAL